MSKCDIVGSGLANMGNTCFFNATIQCILHSVPFSRDLMQKRHSQKCTFDQWCVYCQMEDTWDKTKNNKVFQPRKLVHNLKKLFKKFKLGRQQDSHQFLRYFIEGLQKSDIGSKQKNPQKIKVLTQTSRIFSLFGGLMKSTVECQSCHYKSQILEHSYDLSLQCQKSNSVQQSLTNFFRVDHLSGNNKYQCSSCKKLVNAKKYFLINKLPSVLTIQLKRFTNSLHKLNKFVQFPQTLQLQKYCENKNSSQYKLSGVVVHAGSSSFSGHYYSFNKVGNNWFKMDDSYVSKVQKQTVFNQRAYLLFYQRVKNSQEYINEETKQIQVTTTTQNRKIEQTKRQPPEQKLNKKGFFQQISQAINKRKEKQQTQNASKLRKQSIQKQEIIKDPKSIASNKNVQQSIKQKQSKPKQVQISKKNQPIVPEQLGQIPLLRRQSSSRKYPRKSLRIRNKCLQRLRSYNQNYYCKQILKHLVQKGQQIAKIK